MYENCWKSTGNTYSQRRSLKIGRRTRLTSCFIHLLILGRSRATALLSEIISGITLYFDKALGNNLLYRFERAQYVEQKRASPDKPMSEIYGAEHLLRLFGWSTRFASSGLLIRST